MEETIGKLTAGTGKGGETMCHEEQTKEEIEAAEHEVQKEDFQNEDLDTALQNIMPQVKAIPAHEVRRYIASIVYVVALSMRILRAFTEDRERIASLFSPQGFLLKTYQLFGFGAKLLCVAGVDLKQGLKFWHITRVVFQHLQMLWRMRLKSLVGLYALKWQSKN